MCLIGIAGITYVTYKNSKGQTSSCDFKFCLLDQKLSDILFTCLDFFSPIWHHTNFAQCKPFHVCEGDIENAVSLWGEHVSCFSAGSAKEQPSERSCHLCQPGHFSVNVFGEGEKKSSPSADFQLGFTKKILSKSIGDMIKVKHMTLAL